ncbi:hypothetical protein Q3V23_17470 [Streptomyces sp. VNUA116]|uniref:hypothetical protein n=1 Tax=Streptomyces sp. VNUA116 TaxID=3062449 RepID=UPI0026760565|nr:hypothetical protein [Streptomyces sp. VNUA116]WKU45698.1 hypothetical protein Q3V23_17470 [Streptomyces sp. VNUA116]
MSENYEYFVEAVPTVDDLYSVDRPSSMWRRLGDQWEYLSLIDWHWHNVKDTNVKYPPVREALRPISVERAAELESDRQGWVRYWAYHTSERAWRAGNGPTTVVRRRNSPEDRLDETFMRNDAWERDTAIFEFYDARASNPPHLVELSPDEAEELLQELRGVTGATEL